MGGFPPLKRLTQVVTGISANPMRNPYVGVGGISETTWATEMVHLSEFAEFCEDLNGHTCNIATRLQMIVKCKKKKIFKCTFREVHYANGALRDMLWPRFSAPITFSQLEPCKSTSAKAILSSIFVTINACYITLSRVSILAIIKLLMSK